MNQENTFSYKYSAKDNKKMQQEKYVEKIRTQYTEKEYTQLDALKALDAKVKRPVNVFAYIFGSIGAIIMGSGMSLVMTDIGSKIGVKDGLVPGIIIGVLGLFMACINYPFYKAVLASRRKKYADEIMELSDSIMENN